MEARQALLSDGLYSESTEDTDTAFIQSMALRECQTLALFSKLGVHGGH